MECIPACAPHCGSPGNQAVAQRVADERLLVTERSEIRYCGSNNLQIVRRLRAMLENLIQTLPTHRHAMLHQELSLLDREIDRNFSYPEDLALAHVADSQGLGGHSGKTKR